MMEPITWFMVMILGVLGVYVLARLVSKAIFRSYFEEKIILIKQYLKREEKKDEET
jgi:hypothetical protein